MKKIKILVFSFLLILYVLFKPLVVEAATINIGLKTETENFRLTDENDVLVVTIELGDFVNLPEGEPLGYSGELQYDDSIFEEVSVEGLNGWSALFNDENKILIGDTAKAEANLEIARINLKIKSDNVSNMENAVIRIKNVIITDGEFEVSADKQITINIENQMKENNNEDEVQKISNIKEITTIQPEDIKEAKGKEMNNLPDTGLRKNIIIAIIGLIVLAIIFKIKSRKIKY